MIQRDYLMRQVQMLIQALQEVLDLHRQGQEEAALHTIRRTIGALDEGSDGNLRDLDFEAVIAFCRREGAFRPAFAASVADLLKVEGDLLMGKGNAAASHASYARALLLRRTAAAAGAPQSLDAAEEDAWLRERLDEETAATVERKAGRAAEAQGDA